MVLQTIVGFFVISAILYIRWKRGYWKRRNVFTIPRKSLLKNGLTKSVDVGFQELYNEVKSRGLRYGGDYSLLNPHFVPVDINLINRILTTDFQHFTDHSSEFDVESNPLNENLFLLKGAKWKAHRVKLTSLFTSGKMKMMFETLVDCSKGLSVFLNQAEKNGKPIDIKDTFARYTTDVIASIGFGIECNCLKYPDAEFRRIGKLIPQISITDLLVHILALHIPAVYKILKFGIIKKEVENFITKIVQETADYRDKNNYSRKDIMQLLLDLRTEVLKLDSIIDKDVESVGDEVFYQNGLTIKEVAAHAFSFFFAGFETSSTTLNFLMYELATNPKVQEKLRKEINDVLEKHGGKLTYESVSEMTYLERCILESLRKYPPFPVLIRECTKEYVVPDTDLVINKGDSIFIPLYSVQHDPDFYPEPEKFDPDRFTEENKNTRPQCTFLAFGEGPRICIGLRLGMLQTKVGLISVLRNFRFTLSSKTKLPLEFNPVGFILNVKGGIWVNAYRV